VIEARLHEQECMVEGCGASWDPRDCPECGHRDDSEPEPICPKCGHEWSPDVCPACEGSCFKVNELSELLYPADGVFCRACRHIWRPAGPSDDGQCPECGSEEVGESFPDIPGFDDDPGLGLIVAAESQIPRAENGAILHREMQAWLRSHGVRCRHERLQWEKWFVAIGAMRTRVQEELMEPATKGSSDDRED
jgi:hypothetical protein